jgi:sugar phosphate isomerase/epimerase
VPAAAGRRVAPRLSGKRSSLMKLELGIVADEISRDFAQAVKIGKSLGITRYEIRNLVSGRIPMVLQEELREVEQIVKREEVRITAISPGLFKNTCDDAGFQRDRTEIYPRSAELAHRWGLPGIIVFGFHKSAPAGNVPAWFLEAAAQAAVDGLQLMIEPEPICHVDSASAAAKLIRMRSVRLNYDPGNVAWLENRDPIDEFDAAAPMIANVHVKDLRPLERGPENPEWVPVGEGMIDWRTHFQRLREIGYQGPVSLEPHMDGNPETIRRAIVACRTAWEALGSTSTA